MLSINLQCDPVAMFIVSNNSQSNYT